MKELKDILAAAHETNKLLKRSNRIITITNIVNIATIVVIVLAVILR